MFPKKKVTAVLKNHIDEIEQNLRTLNTKAVKTAYATGGIVAVVALIVPSVALADVADITSAIGLAQTDATTVAWYVLGVVAALIGFGLILKMMGLLR